MQVGQIIIQVEVVGSRTEVAQIVAQVEVDYHPGYGQLNEAIGLNDAFSRSLESARDIADSIGFSESFSAFRYTNYQNAIDNPHVGPIRIAKIELPGVTLYLCDRIWGSAGSECEYEDQLYEPLIHAWGDIQIGEVNEIDYKVNPGSSAITIDNNTPVGGADSLAELFATYDPYYAKVTITEFFDATPPTDGFEIFEGYIERAEVNDTSSVTLTLSGFELSISNKFSFETVDIDTYPNADPQDIGKMLPQVYGEAYRVPFRAVDIGWYSTLVEDITDVQTTIEITNADDFASSGTVQIGSEKITYTGVSINQLTGCTRGASSTIATTHDAGTYVVKAIASSADYFYYIIGHAVNAITAVYMGNVRLKSTDYTAYTGKSGNYHASYNGYACIEVKNLSSTTTMGEITADVKGFADDAAGTYTGTANALIERPDSIIKHILLNRCGLAADTINPVSYAAAKAEYKAVTWEVT